MVVGAVVETNFQLRERPNPRRKLPFDVGQHWDIRRVGHPIFLKTQTILSEIYSFLGTRPQRIANAVHYVLMKNYSLQCATVELLRGPSCQFSPRGIRAETFLSGRNAIYALKKGAFQPGLLATYYTFNQGGILEIQKFWCV